MLKYKCCLVGVGGHRSFYGLEVRYLPNIYCYSRFKCPPSLLFTRAFFGKIVDIGPHFYDGIMTSGGTRLFISLHLNLNASNMVFSYNGNKSE